MGEFEGGFEDEAPQPLSKEGLRATLQAVAPSPMCSVKDVVITAAPNSKGIEFKRDESGFKQMTTKKALQELTLMADAPELAYYLRKGDKIFVTAEALATGKWATQVFEMDGADVIIVPVAQVMAYKRQR